MGTEIQEVSGAVWAAIPYLALVKCQRKILVTLYSTLWTISKSHPLEGSCQEAIPLPDTTFDIFSRCVPLDTLHPRLAVSDASVFSFPWCRLPCAAPVTHHEQGLLTTRLAK